MTSRRFCRDCIHMAEWPERVRQYGWMAEAFPPFPLHACMAGGCNAKAVSPSFSPDDWECIAFGCPYFEHGDRKEHYKEV